MRKTIDVSIPHRLTRDEARSRLQDGAARLSAQKAPNKDKPAPKTTTGPEAAEDGEAGPGSLKGRHNPNTSRKKASRRRR